MDKLIAAFSDHLRDALKIGREANFKAPTGTIHNVLITGLGGSGIGGTIVSQLLENELKVPLLVRKNYTIPAFVSARTLVIICSYSGNTEETLSAMQQAMDQNAEISCISTGGRVIELAKANNLNHVIVSGGLPPRAAFAYPFTQLLMILSQYGLVNDHLPEVERAIQLLDLEESAIREKARNLAEKLHNKLPIIYSETGFEGVATRFRQQINENAKMLCWHHVLPEMNHNELVGWTKENEDIAVIFLTNDSDHPRTQKRMEITTEVISKYCKQIVNLPSKGTNAIERSLYLIHLCDWVSYYLSDLNGADPMEVNVIDYLKSELSKF